ncbi:hypothetical protein CsSME_00005303 [Camellia sinensis var. sinensis]
MTQWSALEQIWSMLKPSYGILRVTHLIHLMMLGCLRHGLFGVPPFLLLCRLLMHWFSRRRVVVVLWCMLLFRIGPRWLSAPSHVILCLISLKYCGKDKHDKEHCWKLHGRPTRGRGRGRGRGVRPQAHVSETTASASDDTGSISQDELHTLRRLMARLDSSSALAPSSSASSNFARTCIPASALSASSSSPWIIDSGATDHMMGTSSFELATGKMIGSGRAQSGLYFLYAILASLLSSQAFQCTLGSFLRLLHQWHRHLGHPSFSILEKFFPLEHGILYQTSCVGTLEQNGVVEHKNGHLLEVARSLLFTMNILKSFWGMLVLHFQIPLELLPGTYPTSSLPRRVFGSVCFVHLQPRTRGKLDPKAVRCVFLGYSATQKGYKCYDPHTHKLYRAVICGEGEPSSFVDEESDIGSRLDRADLKTYSWYQKEQASLVPPSNDPQPISSPVVDGPVTDDLSLLIVIRKGVRAFGIVSQFIHDSHATHLDAVYRILRYLKSAPGKGILFSNHGHLRLEAFTDADWAGSIDD